MTFEQTFINGLYEIHLDVFKDDRGWFARAFCKDEFNKIGHQKEWVQINHSFTYQKGTIRGMHFQNTPHSEIKLVRCIAGTVYDVAIDLRKNSPTFLKWYATELSASNKKMIYLPEGFAHGFQALTNDCELIYHHADFYFPKTEGGVNYDDPLIHIKWPLPVSEISERDKSHPYLSQNFKGI